MPPITLSVPVLAPKPDAAGDGVVDGAAATG